MVTSPHVTQSIFISALKRWDREAEKILETSSDSKHIRLVYDWYPLPEHKVVDSSSKRWIAHEAKDIPKGSEWGEPQSPRSDLVGSIPSLESATEITQVAYAYRIAHAIQSQISTAFHDTPFSEVVRAACGLKSSAIQRLSDVALQLRTELYILFRRLDKPSRLYGLVQQASLMESQELHDLLIFLLGARISRPSSPLDH